MDKISKFIKLHPFIAVNILTIVFLFIYQPVALITFMLSIITWAYRLKEAKREKLQVLKANAENYVATVKLAKSLPVIKTSIFLDNGEHGFLDEAAQLSETHSVRQSVGSGVGFRVMKGVYVGGYSGRSESHREWRRLDQGKLILTSQKIVFNGDKENRVLQLKDLVAINIYTYGIELSTQKRTKSSLFRVQNPYIWGAAINIIKGVKDPLHLESVNLDIKIV